MSEHRAGPPRRPRPAAAPAPAPPPTSTRAPTPHHPTIARQRPAPSAAGVSVVLGGFKLLMTMVAVVTVDKLGRRPLLLTGVSLMSVALLVLGTAQSGLLVGSSAPVASLLALLMYVGAYQVRRWWVSAGPLGLCGPEEGPLGLWGPEEGFSRTRGPGHGAQAVA